MSTPLIHLFSQRLWRLLGIALSAGCWYLSTGLTGDFWYLLWIAPIPVLLMALHSGPQKAFVLSFLAYLIGRLSWFSYLVTVATLGPALIFTLALPLIFGLIVLFTRRTVLKTKAWYTMFTFPVLFTTFEFVFIYFSPDGTAGSIAYSQANCLPLIQIASLTGILGITFLVTFVPSALAHGWYYRRDKPGFTYIVGAAALVLIPVFLFGLLRIRHDAEPGLLKVGLAVLDDKVHSITDHPDFSKEKRLTQAYAQEVAYLATQGAQLVVLSERAININPETQVAILATLREAARQHHVLIIIGYTNFRHTLPRNSALVINPEGQLVVDYTKVHQLKGLEDQFTPGRELGLFSFNGLTLGTAICKDLDFPTYINQYGLKKIGFLAIPAWDFVVDDWLHSRMAILRGVENGFGEVRTARLGRLTISDYCGRVTAEASCSTGHRASLVGTISGQHRSTFYTAYGDWFGWLNVVAAFWFIFFVPRRMVRLPEPAKFYRSEEE